MVSKSTKFSTCTYIVRTCNHLYFLKKKPHLHCQWYAEIKQLDPSYCLVALFIGPDLGIGTFPLTQYRGHIVKEGTGIFFCHSVTKRLE